MPLGQAQYGKRCCSLTHTPIRCYDQALYSLGPNLAMINTVTTSFASPLAAANLANEFKCAALYGGAFSDAMHVSLESIGSSM